MLHLPRDDAILDIHLPGAATRAIHTMGTANDLVVLPTIAIELFPLACLWIDNIGYPTHGLSPYQGYSYTGKTISPDQPTKQEQ
jgi:hypothetical protein